MNENNIKQYYWTIFHICSCLLIGVSITSIDKYSYAKVESNGNNWQPSPSHYEIGSKSLPIDSSFMYLEKKENITVNTDKTIMGYKRQ